MNITIILNVELKNAYDFLSKLVMKNSIFIYFEVRPYSQAHFFNTNIHTSSLTHLHHLKKFKIITRRVAEKQVPANRTRGSGLFQCIPGYH